MILVGLVSGIVGVYAGVSITQNFVSTSDVSGSIAPNKATFVSLSANFTSNTFNLTLSFSAVQSGAFMVETGNSTHAYRNSQAYSLGSGVVSTILSPGPGVVLSEMTSYVIDW